MSNVSFETVLEEKGITLFSKLSFETKKEEIELLSKIEKILKKVPKFKYLNDELKQFVLKLDLEKKEIIKKLISINWGDFERIIEERNQTQRKKVIYHNFVEFLFDEFELERKEEKQNKERNIGLKKKDIKVNKIKNYSPIKDFNVEEDLREKCEKYGIDIEFDYTKKGGKYTANDFILYFNQRLNYFKNLLKNRINLENIMRISKLKELKESNMEVSVIGLIYEIKETSKGHIMLTIEDRSGQIKCFINKKLFDKDSDRYNKELEGIVHNLCLDEGIGIKGKVGDDIIWVDEIITPMPPNKTELRKTDTEEYVVFISDLHFGAKVFVDEAFEKFLDWIRGETNNDRLNEIAKKVKHVIIAGDVIEGIGIYPDQGKDARLLDTTTQYHEAARWLAKIPKDKSVIIISGNHDSNRLAEPQPKLPYERASALYHLENVVMLSNPSIVKLFEEELRFYLYHGGSLFYYADNVKMLREKGGAKTPNEVVKYLLEKRHLAPSHGSTLYVPTTEEDPLVIKKMPDFFVCGHTHKMDISNYKGCTILSCGCWVTMSEYQEKMGMYPDVGKCVIINMKTRKPQILNFYKE